LRCKSSTTLLIPCSILIASFLQQCDALNPRCICTFCTTNFHCPTCYRKPSVKSQCRLEAEILAKKEADERAERIKIKDLEDRGQADEVAASVFEFFTSLYETLPPDLAMDAIALMSIGNSENEQVQDEDGGSGSGLLLPSPDSITVTTEFGVSEEQGNVTVITAGPSLYAEPHSPSTVDHEPGQEVEMGTFEDLSQNMLQLGIESALPDNTTEGLIEDLDMGGLSIDIPQAPMEAPTTIDIALETDEETAGGNHFNEAINDTDEETAGDDHFNDASNETDEFGSTDGDAGGGTVEDSTDEGTDTPTTQTISAAA
jgi:hypothetical protein